jgi:hypothetical protein
MNQNDQEFIVQKIRSQYTEKETSQLSDLQKLDARVSRPANIFAYTYGIISALILGVGMCLSMKIIGDAMIPGIIIGVVGLLLVGINYPLYRKLLATRRKKYAAQILQLSDEIMKKN